MADRQCPRTTGRIAATIRSRSASPSSKRGSASCTTAAGPASPGRSEYGGRGASLMQQVIFWQELARAGAPPMANVLGLGTGRPDHHRVRHARRRRSATCRRFSAPRRSGARDSPSRTPGPTSPACRARRGSTATTTSSTGRRCGPATAGRRDWCELVVRTDPAAPKHKGLTVLLVDMKIAGRRGAAAAADDRRDRIQRGLLPRRPRAGGERRRQGEPGLGRGDRHADARARHARRRACRSPTSATSTG